MKEARDFAESRTVVLFEGEFVTVIVVEDSSTEVDEEIDKIFRKRKSVLEAPVFDYRR